MKTAQELRSGNIIEVDGQPMIVERAEYNKSGRNTAVVRLKLKNLLSENISEIVAKADDRYKVILLEKKQCTYSYFADPAYVFMDEEYNPYELGAEQMGDALNYLEDGMEAEVVFFEGRPIAVELPTVVVREIIYTEPAVRGDTSGKVMKPARLASDYTLSVPAFCNIGDKIEIDTRTGEYRSRVN